MDGTTERKLSRRVLWTQAAAQFGTQSVWLMNSYYLLYFYTDVVGIPAAVSTVILLITRVWDAVNDTLMGMICDETHSKEGKARIWLKRAIIPSGICVFLSYYCPDMITPAKCVWVAVTYILQDMALTIVGVPTATLQATMTTDRIERVKLAQYTAVTNMLATFVIPSLALPIVHAFGGDDERVGFAFLAVIIGVLYAVATILLYWGSEGYDPSTALPADEGDVASSANGGADAKKGSLRDAAALLAQALKNPYCTLSSLANVLYLVLAGIMTSTLVYYFRYNLENDSLMSTYSAVLIATSLISVVLLRPLCKRLGNARSCIVGGLICILGELPRLFGADYFLPTFCICIALLGIGSGIVSNLIRQCVLDATTYGKLYMGVSNESVVMSVFTFAQKFGNAIGVVIASGILGLFGYEAGGEVTETIKGVFFAESVVVPMVIALAMIAIFLVIARMEKQLLKDVEAQKTQEAAAGTVAPEGSELA